MYSLFSNRISLVSITALGFQEYELRLLRDEFSFVGILTVKNLFTVRDCVKHKSIVGEDCVASCSVCIPDDF